MEDGEMEIAKAIPINTVTQQLGEIIRLRWKACAFVQLDCVR